MLKFFVIFGRKNIFSQNFGGWIKIQETAMNTYTNIKPVGKVRWLRPPASPSAPARIWANSSLLESVPNAEPVLTSQFIDNYSGTDKQINMNQLKSTNQAYHNMTF